MNGAPALNMPAFSISESPVSDGVLLAAKSSECGGSSRGHAIDVRAIRLLVGGSQESFALAINVPLATLRNWEQKRRSPTGPAAELLSLISHDPAGTLAAMKRKSFAQKK